MRVVNARRKTAADTTPFYPTRLPQSSHLLRAQPEPGYEQAQSWESLANALIWDFQIAKNRGAGVGLGAGEMVEGQQQQKQQEEEMMMQPVDMEALREVYPIQMLGFVASKYQEEGSTHQGQQAKKQQEEKQDPQKVAAVKAFKELLLSDEVQVCIPTT